MADKRLLIIVVMFGIMLLGRAIQGLLETPKAKLRYDRLWPYVLGICWGILAFDTFSTGKPTTIVFISILGVSSLWRVLDPSSFNREDLSNDPGHWKWGTFYYNKDDKRIFPPKASINFANPFSVGVLVLMVVGIVLFCSTWI